MNQSRDLLPHVRAGWATLTVDRPVATTMAVIAICVFGFVSLKQLPVSLMPEIRYPSLTVRTAWPGAAPEEMEESVTEAVEELVGTVEGVVGITSVSRAGNSDVRLDLTWDADLDEASQTVRERLALIEFPEGTEAPVLLRYDPDLDPILRLALTGEGESSDLRRFAEDDLAREIEKIEGVAMVRVLGGLEALISVELDEELLGARGLTAADVVDRLRAENISIAGGELTEGGIDYLVRTVNELDSVSEISEIPLMRSGNAVVRLSDVAQVERATREPTAFTRIDGLEGIEIEIFKEADANLVAVAEAVKERVFGDIADDEGSAEGSGAAASTEVRPEDRPGARQALALPDGARLEVLSDQSTYVRAAIDEVVGAAWAGAAWAVLVVYIFLGSVFATFVIGLSIPLSVIATFAAIRLSGVDLNLMSLGGLALGIGMLVDNSIVVLEAITRRRELGEDERTAAIRGVAEVGSAVVASTMTTVAVFAPIAFVEGIAGQIFGDLATTVVWSLLASLAFALWFVPMLATLPWRFRQAQAAEAAPRGPWWHVQALIASRDDFRALGARLRARSVIAWLTLPIVVVYLVARTATGVVAELVLVRLIGVVLKVAALGIAAVVWLLTLVSRFTLRPLLQAFSWFMDRVTDAYGAMLRGALHARLLILIASAALFAWSMSLFGSLGMQLIPELRQGELHAEIRLPVGTHLDQARAAVETVESALVGNPDIVRVAGFAGERDDALESAEQGPHAITMTVVVQPGDDIGATEERVAAAIRAVVAQLPDATLEIGRPTLFSLADPVSIEVRGWDTAALARSAERVSEVLRGINGVVDVRTTAVEGTPEVRVVFDRERLVALGLDLRTVAEAVRAQVQGTVAGELRESGISTDIEVRIRRDQLDGISDLGELIVGHIGAPAMAGGLEALMLGTGSEQSLALLTGAAGGVSAPIRLSSVATIEIAEGPARIERVDGQRAATVSAATSLLDLEGVTTAATERLASLTLESSQTVFVGGQAEEMSKARTALMYALLLAIFLVYVVMASTFESFVGPFVILFSLPLAVVGVAATLSLAGTPVSVVVLIGLVILAGIVVNNAIVLIDAVITRRREGLGRHDAIVDACRTRLRPILITTLTTVLGLIPMILAHGEGAEIRQPLALTITAGLSSSTLLTLLVVPVVYDLIGEIFGAPQPLDADDVDGDDELVAGS